MAVSTTVNKTAKVPGSQRRTVSEVTFDSSYLEGGEPLTAGELGLTSVDFALCTLKNGSESETVEVGNAWYEPAKSLIHLLNFKTGKEIATTKNVEKVVVQVLAFGV